MIIWAAGLASAIGAIWKFVLPIFKTGKKHATVESRLGDKIDGGFERVSKEIAELDGKISLNRRDIVKLELLSTIRNTPELVEVIEKLYSDYTSLGGNSYVCDLYNAWREEYAMKVLKQRLRGKQ